MIEPNPVGAIEIEVWVGRAGFGEIKSLWLDLAERAAKHFLQHPGWYEAELANIENDASVCFVTVSHSRNGLLAVLPFQKSHFTKNTFKLPFVQLFYPSEMGVNDIFSTVSLVEYQAEIIYRLRKALGYFAFIRWQSILESGSAVSCMKFTSNIRFTHQSKYIQFPNGLDAFWENYSTKFKKGLKKKIDKACENGELSLLCATEGDALVDAFEIFLDIESSGWKGEKGSSIRQQQKKLAFYRSLLQSYGQTNHLQINILYLAETAIAAQFGIRFNDRLYLLKIGFREVYSAISPGYLILARLIETLAQNSSVTTVSFVTGVNWIDRWHPCIDPVGVAYSDNGTLHSRLLLWAMRCYVSYRTTQTLKIVEKSDASDTEMGV